MANELIRSIGTSIAIELAMAIPAPSGQKPRGVQRCPPSRSPAHKKGDFLVDYEDKKV